MDRDELAQLSFSELVDLILRLQAETAGLQARVAKLEGGHAPSPASAGKESRPLMDRALHAEPTHAPVLTSHALEEHGRARRSRRQHHRAWYRRLGGSLLPRTPFLRRTVVLVALAVIVLSVISALLLPAIIATTPVR